MVESIEGFRPELGLKPLGNTRTLKEAQVPVLIAGARQ